MPEAVSPTDNMDGTALGREPESEATVSTRVLGVVLQNLAHHKRGLYFGHREMFRKALVVRVQRNLINLCRNLLANE